MYTSGRKMRHVGQNSKNGSRLTIVYKQIPNDPFHALVIQTDSIPNVDKDEILILLDSELGQKEVDFADALYKHQNFLQYYHEKQFLKRVHIDDIEMLPQPNTPVPLREIINALNEAKGIPPLAETEPRNIAKESVVGETTSESVVPKQSEEEKIKIAEGLLFEASLLQQDVLKKQTQAYELAPSLKPKVKKKRTQAYNLAPSLKPKVKKKRTKAKTKVSKTKKTAVTS